MFNPCGEPMAFDTTISLLTSVLNFNYANLCDEFIDFKNETNLAVFKE